MEVQIAESEDPYDLYKALDPEPQKWEKLGQIAFFASSFSAISAFLPAVAKKNRIYTFIPPGNNYLPPAPQPEGGEANVVEQPRIIPTPRCTADERRSIEELFGTLADNNINITNPFVGIRLYNLGNKIEAVHPLSLLIVMPKETMRGIFNTNEYRIGEVIGGVRKGMVRELGRNNIHRYIPSFAEQMGKEVDPIRRLIQAASWRELVQYLFDIPVL